MDKLDPDRIIDEKVIDYVPGDRKGEPPKALIKQIAYDMPRQKSRKWSRLPCPKKKEKKVNWMNRCLVHDAMNIEFPEKAIRIRNCEQLWRNWGDPDGTRKFPHLRK